MSELLQFARASHCCATRFAAALAILLAASRAGADSIVNFWLSAGDAGPNVPVIYVAPGDTGQVQVWTRPAEGYRMNAFSLDLVSENPDVAALESVRVINPQISDMPTAFRHQVVFDSMTGLFASPHEIYGFLGLSFYDDAPGLPNASGIGPECGDCSMASGSPAWHVATIEFQAGMTPGSSELFLSIGEQGVWQSPGDAVELDPPSDTSVVFGLPNDAVNQWAVLGEGTDHRHSPQGLADAIVQVASADFDQDGDVDGTDFLRWQRGVGVGDVLAEGDANGDGEVDATDLAVWRFQFGSTGGVSTVTAVPAGSAVPEPTGLAVGAVLLSAVAAHRRRLNVR
jgi:hypothetical protein